MTGPWHGGKGDRTRPFDWKKWDKGYERVFGKKKPKGKDNEQQTRNER